MDTLRIQFLDELTDLLGMLSDLQSVFHFGAVYISEEIQDIILCQDASFNTEKNGIEILF